MARYYQIEDVWVLRYSGLAKPIFEDDTTERVVVYKTKGAGLYALNSVVVPALIERYPGMDWWRDTDNVPGKKFFKIEGVPGEIYAILEKVHIDDGFVSSRFNDFLN